MNKKPENYELSFDEFLLRQSKDKKNPKRERTRYILLSQVANHLKTRGKNNFNVDSIIDEAGLSRGTFYNNFKDIEDAKACLILEFLEKSRRPKKISTGVEKHRSNDLNFKNKRYSSILETNIYFCKSYQANAHIYSILSDLSLHNPEILKVRESMNYDWVNEIVKSLDRRRGKPLSNEGELSLKGALRVLITMTIETLKERYVLEDKLLRESFPTADNLAEMLSEIWYKVMSDYENDKNEDCKLPKNTSNDL